MAKYTKYSNLKWLSTTEVFQCITDNCLFIYADFGGLWDRERESRKDKTPTSCVPAGAPCLAVHECTCVCGCMCESVACSVSTSSPMSTVDVRSLAIFLAFPFMVMRAAQTARLSVHSWYTFLRHLRAKGH